jgi:hypothetical protein
MMINAKQFSILTIVASLTLLATGCADLVHKDQTKKLDQAVRAYIHAVRWGDYGAAASFIRPREGTVPPPDLSKLDGIKVTHYDYSIDSRAKGDPEALMTAAFEYYHVDYRSVKKAYQQVMWWWDPQSENWFMDGALPPFHEY